MQKELNYKVLSNKDIQSMCQCGEKMARTILNDIKTEMKLPKYVLLIHFKRYFALSDEKQPNTTKKD